MKKKVSTRANFVEKKFAHVDFLYQGNATTPYCGLLRLDPSLKSLRYSFCVSLPVL